jgi:hypothetical protein
VSGPDDEARLAQELSERLEAILAPYLDREGPDGFPAIVERDAAAIEAMPYSRRDLAVSAARYRRQAADQEAIVRIALEALQGSEALRDTPLAKVADRLAGAVRAGRPSRERNRTAGALRELYPDDRLPSEVELGNAELTRRVNEVLRRQNLTEVSRETVARARQECAK